MFRCFLLGFTYLKYLFFVYFKQNKNFPSNNTYPRTQHNTYHGCTNFNYVQFQAIHKKVVDFFNVLAFYTKYYNAFVTK